MLWRIVQQYEINVKFSFAHIIRKGVIQLMTDAFRDEVLKVLDDIRVSGEITGLRNNFWNIERKRKNNNEHFFMPYGTDSLIYELDKKEDIELLFDVKHPYDSRSWGRNYNIYNEDNKAIIEFTKTTDSREDVDEGREEFKVFIAVLPSIGSDIQIIDEWEKKEYSLDKQRSSSPVERFVYKCLKINSDKLIISFSENKGDAIKICDNISKNLSKIKTLQENYSKVTIKNTPDKKTNIAAKCAIESLDNLLVNKGDQINLYAGLPWFFQFWSRDTLISLKALMLDKEYKTVKKILMHLTDNISENGLLSNRIPKSVINSADSIGWLFKRWDNFFELIRKDECFSKYLKKSDINFITKKLEASINNVFKNYTVDNLAKNNNQETWMDTLYNGDGRSGARIEIQALRLCMYDFLYNLTNKPIYKDMGNKLHKKTKEIFWTGKYLKDGHNDDTIRPNVFIAAYLYPGLLTKKEWTTCFNFMLPKLWLEWGGLSTIDQSHTDFHRDNTGEDSSSYHHGDSWFWVNNLAALVLYRLDKKNFNKEIKRIIEASSDDILYGGFIGCHAEVSSASIRKSEGCLSQAWSNAFFVELIDEMNS